MDWASAKVIGYELNELKGMRTQAWGYLVSMLTLRLLGSDWYWLCLDGTLHESFMQAYEVHEEMKASWPK